MSRPDDRSTPTATRTTAAGISVRRATVADAAAFAAMLAHPDVFAQLLQLPYADPDLWRARLGDGAASGKSDLRLLAVTEGGEVIGSAGLHPAGASLRRRHAMALGMQVQPAWQGQGVGTLLLTSLCDDADNWLGLLRLELEVYTDNHKAQALYRRWGFVDEDVHRCHALRDGVYVDSLSMARLNPAPLRGFPVASA